jgi:hypothetical protein
MFSNYKLQVTCRSWHEINYNPLGHGVKYLHELFVSGQTLTQWVHSVRFPQGCDKCSFCLEGLILGFSE